MEVKTADGAKAEVGKHYYNEYGEEVILDRVVVDHNDNKTWFLVTPFYEGETIEAKLYPSGHSEISAPYEHYGEPRLVRAIWADEPDPKLGPKHKRAEEELRSLAVTVGDLKQERTRLLEENRELISRRDDASKQYDSSYACLVKRQQDLAAVSEQVNEKLQLLSELEDSCGEFEGRGGEDLLVSKKWLEKTNKKLHKLYCLEAGGVDNWDNYDDSLEKFWKRYPNG